MIAVEHYYIIAMNDPPRGGIDLFDLDAAAEYSGMHPDMISEFGRAQFVTIAYRSENGAVYFDREGVRRLRKIEMLRSRRRVDLHTIRYITQLLDKLAVKEQGLRSLREELEKLL